MRQYVNDSFRHFLHGADYNPEQWRDTPEVWEEDMRLMKLAHCNEMSVGIFSWSVLEPREGEYDFSVLDGALDRIYRAGGRVFLATPSGARPRWMADRYPEVLRVNAQGQRAWFGHRHNHCITSPYYRKKTYEMNKILAERYGAHPAVIGWHVSNEYGGECFCPLCRRAFQEWLEKKYEGDIERLNFQWWTTFWSHRFADFSEIDPPSPLGDQYASLQLDWRRFVTDQTASFLRNEIAAIRTCSSLPTTTNFMHRYTQLNYSVLAREIDVVSWDSYPEWHPGAPSEATDDVWVGAETALTHDAFRALKKRPFLLMESTPSMVNWKSYNKLKRPGMHKLSSLQAVAHGSDSVQYFQWRKSRGSNEKFHGAVVDHAGGEHTRVFSDVREVGIALEKIEAVLGTVPQARVALIMDVENDWALEVAEGFQKEDKRYYSTCLSCYRQLWQRGIDTDVVDAHADLYSYDLVIAPMLYMTSADTVARLTDFVKNGGTLVSGYMLGMVNENDLCYLGGFPANELKDVFGLVNEEIDTLYPEERNAVTYRGKRYAVKDYCERVRPYPNTEVLATYEADFYAGEPALLAHAYGKGRAYYLATRDEGALFSDLLDTILCELDIKAPIASLPYGVTCHTRQDEQERYLFLENYNPCAVSVDLGAPKYDLERAQTVGGEITLEPYGIRIYRL